MTTEHKSRCPGVENTRQQKQASFRRPYHTERRVRRTLALPSQRFSISGTQGRVACPGLVRALIPASLSSLQSLRLCVSAIQCPLRRWLAAAAIATALTLLAGCHIDMWIQPKVKPYQASDFFADHDASRPLVPGVVARKASPDELRVGNPFYTAIDPNTKKLLDSLPPSIPLNAETLHRGQERFNIYCSPCHGRLGDGKGMIAQRGLALRKQPGNYHTARLLKAPLGHFYDVITNGYGVMFSYAQRVEPDDRWKIAAYIRVLQLSENAKVSDVPADKVQDLDKPAQTPTGSEPEPK